MSGETTGPFFGSPEQIAALCAALVQAQAAAQAVAKDATNTFHGYRYASAESVIDEARHALSAAGLALITLSYGLTPRDVESDDKERSVVRGAIMRMTYRLVHSAGAHVEITDEMPAIPGKGRPVDKAIQVAKTASLAYVLRGVTMLPRVEAETELAGRDDSAYEPPPPVKQAQPAADVDRWLADINAAVDLAVLTKLGKAAPAAVRGDERVRVAFAARQRALKPATNGGAHA